MPIIGLFAAATAKWEAEFSDAGYRGAVDNRSDRVDRYLGLAGRLPNNPNQRGAQWCGIFVYWCYSQAATRLNIPNPLPHATFGGGALWTWALAPRHSDWIVWQPGQNNYPILEAGDIFVVSNHGHVGMVAESNNNSDPIFTSVEGNQTDPAHSRPGDKGVKIRPHASLNNCSIIIRVPERN